MNTCSFDTQSLKCRPLVDANFNDFVSIVSSDKEIQKYFRFGNTLPELLDFYASIQTSNCINVGIFLKNTSALIGYINGYIYSSDELLVELFISESFRCEYYAFEALEGYFVAVSKLNFTSFRFEVEPGNCASISLLDKFLARELEPFKDESTKREFLVYEVCL